MIVHTLCRALLLCAVFVLASTGFAQAHAPRTVVVFAAASLADAFEDMATGFEAAHPGIDVIFSFAGSPDLAAQLAAGAPADVFASANTAQMQAAIDAGRIAGRPLVFAGNRLVLITPADNPAGITGLADLSRPGIRLLTAVPGVPVRVYTDMLLERLAADPAFGESYPAAVLANIVSEEQNVRQVAAKIALGEADAGIVYISDVTPEIADDVLAFPIPDAVNALVSYPIALIADAPERSAARLFMRYVLSRAGQQVLACWNFVPVRTTSGEACTTP